MSITWYDTKTDAVKTAKFWRAKGYTVQVKKSGKHSVTGKQRYAVHVGRKRKK